MHVVTVGFRRKTDSIYGETDNFRPDTLLSLICNYRQLFTPLEHIQRQYVIRPYCCTATSNLYTFSRTIFSENCCVSKILLLDLPCSRNMSGIHVNFLDMSW